MCGRDEPLLERRRSFAAASAAARRSISYPLPFRVQLDCFPVSGLIGGEPRELGEDPILGRSPDASDWALLVEYNGISALLLMHKTGGRLLHTAILCIIGRADPSCVQLFST